ncbi:MAG: S8 family serine peptidase, partial [Verrucomicrobiales bacterium]|nr:S8 family serine peptidase [Verrucomicrobiales bacterium]
MKRILLGLSLTLIGSLPLITLPAQEATVAPLRVPETTFGPKRTSPDVPLPRHAYSPFDKLDQPPPYQPGPGRDYNDGELVLKLAPEVIVNRKVNLQSPGTGGNVGLTSDSRLNRALATAGIPSLHQVFPNAKVPAQRTLATQPPEPDLTRWYRALSASTTTHAVELLSPEPGIEVVEPDYLRALALEPVAADISPRKSREPGENAPTEVGGHRISLAQEPPPAVIPSGDSDPLFAQQWHLGAVNAFEAWAWLDSQGLPPGGDRDIVIAVIDTGVALSHPDLAANLWVNGGETGEDAQGQDKRTNGVDDDGNGFVDDVHGCRVVYNQFEHTGDPSDDHGHGTHVAGIIAAQAGNHEGGVGIAYNCQIMAIKAAQYSGVLASSDIAEAINYAVQQGADIINMSFGGYVRSQIEEDALAVAFGQCVLVAAAGNDAKVNLPCPGGRDLYPAAYNWVLGVMASTSGGSMAAFSNHDCKPHDSHEYELMAPGVDIWSALPPEEYAAWDGTSMAAPVVSGIAALARTRWGDKDVYSSRFIMGQIAANAAPVADALAALATSPTPELSYLQHWLFDTTEQAEDNDADG